MKKAHKGKIGFVRHGQTHANVAKIWHGHTDTELTDTGHQQIKRLGEHFHHYMQPDVIYASPLQRAHLTAQGIGDRFDLSVNLDPRLMEIHLGDWEGGNQDTLNEPQEILEQLVKNPHFAAPNGESQELVRRRFVAAMDEIIQKHPAQNIVIVAHGISIGIALSHYLKNDTTHWPKYSKNNTAFSELCLNSNQLLRYNLTDHLGEDEA